MEVEKLYLWDIDDKEGFGVFRISQVLEPAMESDFIAFSKDVKFIEKTDEVKIHEFSIDDEKMRVVGAILIPNKKFYRKELEGFAMFSKEAVEKARLTFKKNNNMFSVNVEHSDKGAPAFLLEDWIVEDKNNDKSSKWNLSFEEGTWIGVMQITDKNYWNDYIKSGKVRGFSIELDGESVKEKKLFNMEKKNVKKLGEATLQDGTQIYFEGDTIEVGTAIFMDAELSIPAPDGEHIDPSGNVIVTVDGIVTEIKEAVAEEEVVEEAKEYALKSEMTSIIAELQSRIEKLESEISKKNEELEKQVKELKSNTPGGKSFVFGKKKETEKLSTEKENVKFSDRLKKTYQELGKL